MDNKANVERFRSIMSTVKRPGIEKLMEFIEKKVISTPLRHQQSIISVVKADSSSTALMFTTH